MSGHEWAPEPGELRGDDSPLSPAVGPVPAFERPEFVADPEPAVEDDGLGPDTIDEDDAPEVRPRRAGFRFALPRFRARRDGDAAAEEGEVEIIAPPDPLDPDAGLDEADREEPGPSRIRSFRFPLPRFRRARAEAVEDADPAEASAVDPGEADPGAVDPDQDEAVSPRGRRFPAFALTREARVGMAAALSFAILVSVWISNKGRAIPKLEIPAKNGEANQGDAGPGTPKPEVAGAATPDAPKAAPTPPPDAPKSKSGEAEKLANQPRSAPLGIGALASNETAGGLAFPAAAPAPVVPTTPASPAEVPAAAPAPLAEVDPAQAPLADASTEAQPPAMPPAAASPEGLPLPGEPSLPGESASPGIPPMPDAGGAVELPAGSPAAPAPAEASPADAKPAEATPAPIAPPAPSGDAMPDLPSMTEAPQLPQIPAQSEPPAPPAATERPTSLPAVTDPPAASGEPAMPAMSPEPAPMADPLAMPSEPMPMTAAPAMPSEPMPMADPLAMPSEPAASGEPALPSEPAPPAAAPAMPSEPAPVPMPAETPRPPAEPRPAVPVPSDRTPPLDPVPATPHVAEGDPGPGMPSSSPGIAPKSPAMGEGWVTIKPGGKRVLVSTPSSDGIDLAAAAGAVGGVAAASIADGPAPREDVVARDQVELKLHRVRSGENFWTISRLYYGSGRYYQALHAANKADVPRIDELWVGTVIRVPSLETLDRSLIQPPSRERVVVDRSPGASVSRTSNRTEPPADDAEQAIPARPATRRRPEVEAPEEPPSRPVYKVRGVHETLRGIARDTLGDPRRYREILNLNRSVIDENSPLTPGQTITLPADAEIGRRSR